MEPIGGEDSSKDPTHNTVTLTLLAGVADTVYRPKSVGSTLPTDITPPGRYDVTFISCGVCDASHRAFIATMAHTLIKYIVLGLRAHSYLPQTDRNRIKIVCDSLP